MDEPYEWDERRGWGPYDLDDNCEDSSDDDCEDLDNDCEDPNSETLPTHEPQSRASKRGDSGNAAPSVRREYHESIDGKCLLVAL